MIGEEGGTEDTQANDLPRASELDDPLGHG